MTILTYSLPDKDLLDDASPLSVLVWQPDEIYLVLGQSNKMEESLMEEAVTKDNVHVMCRPSGGQTVILTPRTLVISIAFDVVSFKNPSVYFSRINNCIIGALDSIGITGLSTKGVSDISFRDKKILGSSIYRRRDRVLYHAVLNVSEDIGMIEKFIKHPPKEPDYRKGRSHRDFVTSLHELGFEVPINDLAETLKLHLKKLDFSDL
jgi:lipoate---protein ligase